MRGPATLLSALVALVPACKRNEAAGETPIAGSDDRTAALALAGPLETPAAVPATAAMLLVVRTPSSMLDALVSADPFGSPDVAEIDALRQEIDGYLEANIGLRLADTRTVAMFGIAEGTQLRAGAVLLGTAGKPMGQPFAVHAGVEMVRMRSSSGELIAARVGAALVLGEEAAVRAAIDQASGGVPGPLAASLAKADGAAVGLAVDFLSPVVADLEVPKGVDGMVSTIGGGGVTVVLSGKPAALERVRDEISSEFAQAVEELEEEKERALKRDDASIAVGTTLAHYWARRFRSVFTPVLAGDKLVLDVDVSMKDPAVLTAAIGVVAAIAIPALIKYMRRSKTSEARMNIARMFDAASAFFSEEHVQRRGESFEVVGELPPHMCPSKPGQLQGSSGVTPPFSVDCSKGPGGRCVPATGSEFEPGFYDIALWTENPVWNGLNFQMERAHYFHYNFVYSNAATGFGACQFTAQAFGDLDADGVFSTYERAGAADENGVNAAAGLYIDNELE